VVVAVVGVGRCMWREADQAKQSYYLVYRFEVMCPARAQLTCTASASAASASFAASSLSPPAGLEASVSRGGTAALMCEDREGPDTEARAPRARMLYVCAGGAGVQSR
jgi:hypothetical protein